MCIKVNRFLNLSCEKVFPFKWEHYLDDLKVILQSDEGKPLEILTQDTNKQTN